MSIFLRLITLPIVTVLFSCQEKRNEKAIETTVAHEERLEINVKPQRETLIIEKTLSNTLNDSVKLQVRLYEAESLKLGHYYSNREQLKGATLLADISVTNKIFEESIIGTDDDRYYLKSEVSSHSDHTIKGISLQLNFLDLTLDYESDIKIGSSRFMEHSTRNDTSKVYVYEISLIHPSKGEINDK